MEETEREGGREKDPKKLLIFSPHSFLPFTKSFSPSFPPNDACLLSVPIYEEETKENLSRELNIVSAFESCSGLIGNANATGGKDKVGVSNRATTHFGTTYNGGGGGEISVFMNPLSPHALPPLFLSVATNGGHQSRG